MNVAQEKRYTFEEILNVKLRETGSVEDTRRSLPAKYKGRGK